MERLIAAAFVLLLVVPAAAQMGSGSSGSGGAATPGSSGPVPLTPPPLAPNVTPTQSTSVSRPGEPPPRVDPSPTQAAPLPSELPRTGGATPPRPPTPVSSAARGSAPPANADERERQRREAKLRANEERLRKLISDICTGCTGAPLPRP